MWRALVYLGLLCLAAYGAVWLANHPETVAITWGGREYSTSLAVGVVGFIALAALLALVLSVVQMILRAPTTWGRRARERRERRGLRALTRGIVAVGSGDATAARRHAGDAERLLGRTPLALLLRAQSAQAAGDREGAEGAFRLMTEDPETRVLGLRGLYVEAKRRGDALAARDCASEAARIAPAVGWASDAVLESLSADGDWAGAVRLIERRASLGLVDKTASRRQRAVLHAADALAREEGDPIRALSAAEEAVRLAPDLVPAAALAGRLLARQGDLKRAARVIEAAWRATPHPELAGAYLNLRPGDSATDRLRRAETLAKLSSWSDEARLAIARAAIEARELDRARDAVKPLLAGRPTVRTCLLMAELETRAGAAGGAREWLARAARAPRDKAWIADGVVSDRWAPFSPATGRLDAFRWETPPDLLAAPADALSDVFTPEGDAAERPPVLPPPRTEPNTARSDPEPAAAVAPKPAPSPPPPSALPAADAPAAQPARSPEPAAGSPLATPAAERRSTAAPDAEPKRTQPPSTERPSSVVPVPPPLVAEPVGSEPPRRGGANGTSPARGPQPTPAPVIFPVAHAPDDPGPDGEGARQARFMRRG